ncbi:MAG TPA: CvpA family protein [Spirochaetia bacterium]|nr:CvpA family protein [Spirochaetales bacterium]HRY81140.1 CvpA family protein [Spirochaetia bacterium]HRZ89367.1 CvpA family protein [Spirochaetia bacterium]
MNALDLVLFVVILLFALRCYFRGFVAELLSMAAVILGVFLAILFYRPAGELLAKYLALESFTEVLGFAVVFLLVFLLIKILQGVLRSVIENINLQNVDRGLGFLLGAAEGLLLSSLLLMLMRLQPVLDLSALLEGSFLGKNLLPVLVSAARLGA